MYRGFQGLEEPAPSLGTSTASPLSCNRPGNTARPVSRAGIEPSACTVSKSGAMAPFRGLFTLLGHARREGGCECSPGLPRSARHMAEVVHQMAKPRAHVVYYDAFIKF